jgi:hypothetical protein
VRQAVKQSWAETSKRYDAGRRCDRHIVGNHTEWCGALFIAYAGNANVKALIDPTMGMTPGQ